MLKTIILVLLTGIAVAVFAVVASMQPDQFKVTRSTVIAAPAAEVFAQVNDLHNWQAWSPWAKIDPNAKEIFEGPRAGKGAVFKWAGNNKVGEGGMIIYESRANERIAMHLEFLRPFKASNSAEFTFKPEGNGTRVTWSMSGENSFVAKAIGLVMNCDKMVGRQFEKGLAQLKSVVES